MSREEYEADFDRLSQFAPEWVDSDEKNASKFEEGLSGYLQIGLSIFNLTSYEEMVSRAKSLEYSYSKNMGLQSGKSKEAEETKPFNMSLGVAGKNKFKGPSGKSSSSNFRGGRSTTSRGMTAQPAVDVRPTCLYCGNT